MDRVAESIGPLAAEVHRIRTADGAELALTRVPPAARDGHGTPVVLVHGNYARRNFWVSPKGIGLAPFVAEHGFDAWVVELRGHGLSPKGPRFSSITAEDHARRDLPAVQSYVAEVTARPAFWAAHSAGGLYVLGALAMGWLDAARTRGVTTFGTQLRDGEGSLRFPGVALLSSGVVRLIGHLPAPRLGLGPEIEPAEEIVELIRWKARGGRWRTRAGASYDEALRKLDVPAQAFAGSGDANDPPRGCRALLATLGGSDKTFVELGRAAGFARDYGHVDMVVSKEAAAEVWPLVTSWMEARRLGGLFQTPAPKKA